MESAKVQTILKLLEDTDTNELEYLTAKAKELLQKKIDHAWRGYYEHFLDDKTRDLETLLEKSEFVEEVDSEIKLSHVNVGDYIIDNDFDGISIHHRRHYAKWSKCIESFKDLDVADIQLAPEYWDETPNLSPDKEIVKYALFLLKHRC